MNRPEKPEKRRTPPSKVLGYPSWRGIPRGVQEKVIGNVLKLAEIFHWVPRPSMKEAGVREGFGQAAKAFHKVGSLDDLVRPDLWNKIHGDLKKKFENDRSKTEWIYWDIKRAIFREYAQLATSAERRAKEDSQRERQMEQQRLDEAQWHLEERAAKGDEEALATLRKQYRGDGDAA